MTAAAPAQEENSKPVIYRSDYRPPAFWVRHVDLSVNVLADKCEVTAVLSLERNTELAADAPLRMQGENMALLSISLDGAPLSPEAYSLNAEGLCIENLPDSCTLQVVTAIDPAANTSLDGLYASGDMLCTQCEAHGFSRITYFPDRPDILATYRVSIEADRGRYPVLLSNGNCVESSELGQGRHRVVWEDPHPKPCYLFALVAGDLACVEDGYTTASGRPVSIRFYVEHGDESRCGQAIQALKAAMAWDEQTYGLEYDLDLYMVVAVGSFNMGAMENKGLNIFNSKYVLADPETATDTDYELIQAVIGHEYFHNWTGNRVTCRDWFQLSLKEGLTVFREQQFMEHSLASSTQRLEQVRMLRSQQFAEDAGPMAHPVRPESYIEVNNFYTLTVYEKGAELIRMMHGLLGQARFREGLRLYLQRHDGTAATIDDFVNAMAEAGQCDLSHFQRWYSQAGTPLVKVREHYDAGGQTYRLELRQSTPATPGQADKDPVPIPMRLSLLDTRGGKSGVGENAAQDITLLFDQATQSYEFKNQKEPPLPVFLRGFSAPVKLEFLYTREQLSRIVRDEDDAFCRWDAMQRLFQDFVADGMGSAPASSRELSDLAGQLLLQVDADPALIAELLRLPGETLLAEQYEPVPVEALVESRDRLEAELATAVQEAVAGRYRSLCTDEPYVFEGQAASRRRLKNLCLYYWARASDAGRQAALGQFRMADNMTDRLGALEALNHLDCAEREWAMQAFAESWHDRPLVMDKWRMLQATSRLPGALQRVKGLRESAGFDANNPNRIRSLVGSFGANNLRGFHAPDGQGYFWLAEEVIRLDSVNPQVAARLVTPLCRWQRHESRRAGLMCEALRQIAAQPKLSGDVYEIVTKAL